MVSPSRTSLPPLYLDSEQAEKLKQVLARPIPIHPSNSSSFPTLQVVPSDFLRSLLTRLLTNKVDLSAVRLNGGAASYVLTTECDFVYRDLDILFFVTSPLSEQRKTSLFSSSAKSEQHSADLWTIIKYVVCSCVLEQLHSSSSKSSSTTSHQYSHHYVSSLLDTYAKKNVHIQSDNGDSWALLSLQNLLGYNLELKFVERLKRQWQFSVDSFQIDIKPLLVVPPTSPISQQNSSVSRTRTIHTKNLTIGAINGLTIIKEGSSVTRKMSSGSSPIQFGFFTPSSSPEPKIAAETQTDELDDNDNVFETLATMTTVHTSGDCSKFRYSRSSTSTTTSEASTNSQPLQFQMNDDVDEGVVADEEEDLEGDGDSVFRTPIGPSSPTEETQKIEVFSVYNDVRQALEHLNRKVIATYEPEVVRGGGLLKYCNLLARGYTRYDERSMLDMERYMTSRFFIDYKHPPEQMSVIAQYIQTHFLPSSLTPIRYMQQQQLLHPGYSAVFSRRMPSTKRACGVDPSDVVNSRLSLLFLEHLSNTISRSTVCLTKDDKHTTLMHIAAITHDFLQEYAHLTRLMGNEVYQHQQQSIQHSSFENNKNNRYDRQQQSQPRELTFIGRGGYNSGSNSSCNSSRSSSPSRSSSTTSTSTQNSFRCNQQHHPQQQRFYPHLNNNNFRSSNYEHRDRAPAPFAHHHNINYKTRHDNMYAGHQEFDQFAAANYHASRRQYR